MTAEARGQAWREQVRVFREAAAALASPAAQTLGDMAALEAWADSMTQELPLAGFSPFGGVPDYALGSESAQAAEMAFRRKTAASRRRDEAVKQPIAREIPLAANEVERPKPTMPGADAQPPSVTPVFSFRRANAPGAMPRLTRGVQAAKQDVEAGFSVAPAGGKAGADLTSQASSRQESQAEISPTAPSRSDDLMGGLAESVLSQGQRRDEYYSESSSAPTRLDEDVTGGREAQSRFSFTRAQPGFTGALSQAEASWGSESEPLGSAMKLVETLAERILESQREASSRQSKDTALSGAVGLAPTPGRQTSGNDAEARPSAEASVSKSVELIDAIAKQLVNGKASAANGDTPNGDFQQSNGAAQEGRMLPNNTSTIAEDEAKFDSALLRGLMSSTPSGGLGDEELISIIEMNSERVAALVNEILVEQARRHGVNLS